MDDLPHGKHGIPFAPVILRHGGQARVISVASSHRLAGTVNEGYHPQAGTGMDHDDLTRNIDAITPLNTIIVVFLQDYLRT